MIPSRLTALGHPRRLDIFRLLFRRYPDRVPAGEIAAVLDLKPSTLSTYLASLAQVGLVSQHRVGTSLRYSIDMPAVKETFDFLIFDCCRGRPDLFSALALPSIENPNAMSDSKFKVLFICTGNSARSIFAESILRKEAGDRFEAYSAGTIPSSQLNPFALEVLDAKGHDISGLRSKNVVEFQGGDAPKFDFVFTVCDRAANEECPAWHGQPVSAHWGVPDPVKAEGSDAEKSLAFQSAYGALRNRIVAFTSLPFESLDRVSLQAAVDDLSKLAEGETA